MKVLFLMFSFPDMNLSFNMFTTLVEEFNKQGHDVRVIAPGSNKTGIYIEKSISVLRVKTLPIKNVSNIAKGISNVLLPFQYMKSFEKYYNDFCPDLIILPTPPVTLVDIASKIKNRYKSKVLLILRDIFPQNAVDLGFMKENGLVHRYFKIKEKKLYKISDFIGCMSQENVKYILRHNPQISELKLFELPNWQVPYRGYGHNSNLLLSKYNLADKFLVIFGGNMGKPQQLENVLMLAQNVSQYKEIHFVFLGEGVQMEKIKGEIKALKLSNITVLDTISKQEYQDLLTVVDVGLISLHKDFTIPNIPSKALDYWNVGLPVLASIDAATDLDKILLETHTGLCSIAGDHDSFLKNLLFLYNNPELRKTMRENARNYFNKNLLPEHTMQRIMKRFKEA